MRIDVLTIFPGMFFPFFQEGILSRGIKKGLIEVGLVNIRDFARGSHKSTDDRPYGGGDGMVMKPGPIHRALNSVDRMERNQVILLSPQGAKFDQQAAWEFSTWDHLIFVCGRYEGVDERIKLTCIDRELSIGDYVLSGGELGAMVVMDAVSRLIPGVLGGERSNLEDSFENGLLEYPHYTRPRIFMGEEVPPVLLSGDHGKIRLWRRRESLKRTYARRPDLLLRASLTPEDERLLSEIKGEHLRGP
jgi:tRNA (guanine37-N1)-methyltransferase